MNAKQRKAIKAVKGLKISNMQSGRGNAVPNQFVIDMPGGSVFQSYQSIIVFKDYENGQVYLDKTYWDYSVTTGKYRNQFLQESKKETQRKIDSGEYILADLN